MLKSHNGNAEIEFRAFIPVHSPSRRLGVWLQTDALGDRKGITLHSFHHQLPRWRPQSWNLPSEVPKTWVLVPPLPLDSTTAVHLSPLPSLRLLISKIRMRTLLCALFSLPDHEEWLLTSKMFPPCRDHELSVFPLNYYTLKEAHLWNSTGDWNLWALPRKISIAHSSAQVGLGSKMLCFFQPWNSTNTYTASEPRKVWRNGNYKKQWRALPGISPS